MAKYYYNEILLPEVPTDVLAQFPYCFIVFKYENSQYQLLFSTTVWRYNETEQAVDNYTTEKSPLYTCAEGAAAWTSVGTGNYQQPLSDGSREMVWSNHDICIGETSAQVYYVGTTPLTEEEYNASQIVPDAATYHIKGETLQAFAKQARRLGSTKNKLTIEQMLAIFESVNA